MKRDGERAKVGILVLQESGGRSKNRCVGKKTAKNSPFGLEAVESKKRGEKKRKKELGRKILQTLDAGIQTGGVRKKGC